MRLTLVGVSRGTLVGLWSVVAFVKTLGSASNGNTVVTGQVPAE